MTHPYYPGGNPSMNHVAMSVPADLLDESNRADLVRYFDQAFPLAPKTVCQACKNSSKSRFLTPSRLATRLGSRCLAFGREWAYSVMSC